MGRPHCPKTKHGLPCRGYLGHRGFCAFLQLTTKTKPPQKRAQRRRSGRVHDSAYLAKVRATGYCSVAVYGVPSNRISGSYYTACIGPVEADHMGERPVGRKASDDTAVPMCRAHHRDRTDHSGLWSTYSARDMRDYCDAMIDFTRENIANQSTQERPGHSSRALAQGLPNPAGLPKSELRSGVEDSRTAALKASDSASE